MSVLDDLDRVFPGHRSPDRAAEWEAAKARLPVGSSARGVVVARYHFGVFVDIGVGFPALLGIVRMEGLTPERYLADNWCPVGSSVTAFVGGFDNYGRQIGLWQIQPGGQRPNPALHPTGGDT